MERHFFSESEMALLIECKEKCSPNSLDTADIVRDAIFRQLMGKNGHPLPDQMRMARGNKRFLLLKDQPNSGLPEPRVTFSATTAGANAAMTESRLNDAAF